jgi:hypothetical protein
MQLVGRQEALEAVFLPQIVEPAAAAVKQLEKITYPGDNTVPLKDELVLKSETRVKSIIP